MYEYQATMIAKQKSECLQAVSDSEFEKWMGECRIKFIYTLGELEALFANGAFGIVMATIELNWIDVSPFVIDDSWFYLWKN